MTESSLAKRNMTESSLANSDNYYWRDFSKGQQAAREGSGQLVSSAEYRNATARTPILVDGRVNGCSKVFFVTSCLRTTVV
jgi:hypothetical protein